jgi:hypothetical protein
MLPVGRGLLIVVVLACLVSLPARADALVITLNPDAPLSSGAFDFNRTFTADNDVALIYLSLLSSAVLTIEMTSHLATPAGFDPFLTLFAPGTDFQGSYDHFFDTIDGRIDTREVEFIPGGMLAAGNYLVAITHDFNFYRPGSGFVYDGADSGVLTSELSGGETSCSDFVSLFGECRTRQFAGTISVQAENVQPVPEPGSLTLLALGSAALLVGRGRRSRPGIKTASRK